jgi:hypothetical protein
MVSGKQRDRRWAENGKLTYCCETWSSVAGVLCDFWVRLGVKVRKLGGTRWKCSKSTIFEATCDDQLCVVGVWLL